MPQQSTPGRAYPDQYNEQLRLKVEKTRTEFEPFYPGELEVFASPEANYRMRAEFRVWHEGDRAHFAMYAPGEYKKPILIEDFSIGAQTINRLMPILLEELNQNPILKLRLYQAEFLTTLSGEALVTLIYHRPLDDEWQQHAVSLQAKLGISIIGRSRKQKLTLSTDYVTERFALESGSYVYRQYETGFTQPNAFVCTHMLNWACRVASTLPRERDLLELYCGNGNFTLPLSRFFNKVLATELSKLSTRAALENIELNGVDNVALIRLSAEEVSEAMTGVRSFRRLKDIELDQYDFSTIFVDPPRAGMDAQTCDFASRFDHILYISCNPETLRQNLEQLHSTHEVCQMALFDQFPYSEHRECGVLLRKRQGSHAG